MSRTWGLGCILFVVVLLRCGLNLVFRLVPEGDIKLCECFVGYSDKRAVFATGGVQDVTVACMSADPYVESYHVMPTVYMYCCFTRIMRKITFAFCNF